MISFSSTHVWYHFWPIRSQYFRARLSTYGCFRNEWTTDCKVMWSNSNLSLWNKKNKASFGFYYMVTCRCEISLLVLKIFHSFAAVTREAFFSTLEEKFLVSARPCNILYLLGIYEAQLDNLVLKYINLELRRRFPCAKGKGEVGFR